MFGKQRKLNVKWCPRASSEISSILSLSGKKQGERKRTRNRVGKLSICEDQVRCVVIFPQTLIQFHFGFILTRGLTRDDETKHKTQRRKCITYTDVPLNSNYHHPRGFPCHIICECRNIGVNNYSALFYFMETKSCHSRYYCFHSVLIMRSQYDNLIING